MKGDIWEFVYNNNYCGGQVCAKFLDFNDNDCTSIVRVSSTMLAHSTRYVDSYELEDVIWEVLTSVLYLAFLSSSAAVESLHKGTWSFRWLGYSDWSCCPHACGHWLENENSINFNNAVKFLLLAVCLNYVSSGVDKG
jgi:hypothetical protein